MVANTGPPYFLTLSSDVISSSRLRSRATPTVADLMRGRHPKKPVGGCAISYSTANGALIFKAPARHRRLRRSSPSAAAARATVSFVNLERSRISARACTNLSSLRDKAVSREGELGMRSQGKGLRNSSCLTLGMVGPVHQHRRGSATKHYARILGDKVATE